MTTRFVHVVRCKAKNSDGTLDDTKYADVQVIDQICITTDNGGQETFNFTAANAVPTIVDVAGDGGGIDNGSDATRQSRLIRVTNPNDSTQFFNEEILDQVCITRDNGAQEIWNFSQVNAFISATTGPDIDAGSLIDVLDTLVNDQSSASRLIEVDEIVEGQTAQSTPASDGANYMAVADIQKVCITIDNGGQAIFDFSDAFRDITDTTQYTTDSQGNLIPPDNTDPDPYIVIPSSSGGLSTGNALIQQGPLWKIVGFSSVSGFFVVAGYQQPTDSSIGVPAWVLDSNGKIKTTYGSYYIPYQDGAAVDNGGNPILTPPVNPTDRWLNGKISFSNEQFAIAFDNSGNVAMGDGSSGFFVYDQTGKLIGSSALLDSSPFVGVFDSKGALYTSGFSSGFVGTVQKSIRDPDTGVWLVAWTISVVPSVNDNRTVNIATDNKDDVWIGINNKNATIVLRKLSGVDGSTLANANFSSISATGVIMNFDTDTAGNIFAAFLIGNFPYFFIRFDTMGNLILLDILFPPITDGINFQNYPSTDIFMDQFDVSVAGIKDIIAVSGRFELTGQIGFHGAGSYWILPLFWGVTAYEGGQTYLNEADALAAIPGWEKSLRTDVAVLPLSSGDGWYAQFFYNGVGPYTVQSGSTIRFTEQEAIDQTSLWLVRIGTPREVIVPSTGDLPTRNNAIVTFVRGYGIGGTKVWELAGSVQVDPGSVGDTNPEDLPLMGALP